ncbi:MAG: methyltransferase domain-containing protein [Phycisphaerae bacterium]|nr:methyltransferase domain-containing protein [Phycisphaerae bacterium]
MTENQRREGTELISDIATGFWKSQTLHTAIELELFTALRDQTRSAGDVAGDLALPEPTTKMLLDACCALGLVRRTDAGYANTPASRGLLVRGEPRYLGDAVLLGAQMYGLWGRLGEAVRRGEPVVPPELHLGDDPQKTRQFVLAMHSRAKSMGVDLVHYINLTGRRKLLDLAGGPGTLAALLVQKHPGLRAVVRDLPAVAAIARELLEAAGLTDRIEVEAGDFRDPASFGGDFDAVLLAGMLHQCQPELTRDIIQRAHETLEPGGVIYVVDLMLDPAGTAPLMSALFALNMLLISRGGRVYRRDEIAAMLSDSGFESITEVPDTRPAPHAIVWGVKPALLRAGLGRWSRTGRE